MLLDHKMLLKDTWTIHPFLYLEMTINCLAKSAVHQMVEKHYKWQNGILFSFKCNTTPTSRFSQDVIEYFLSFSFFGHNLQVLLMKHFTYLLISSRWSSKSTTFSHFFVVTWSARTTLVEGSFRTSWLLPSDPAWRQLFDESLVYNCMCH